MGKIKSFFALVLIFLSVSLSAQDLTVTGQVTDESTGEGIPFASVILKGTTHGVATDAEGNYSITVPSSGVLEFSSIGYQSTEMPVNGQRRIEASLKTDSEFIDETIVVAYGVQKKSSFVGAAEQVSGEKLATMSSTNISKSLEGAVAGLQTSSSSGTPGSSASIIIRGLGSVSASQEPLLVVDGVPYEGSLNSIASNDIESLTVLKDAAANSMYGARGSNGVIIITTKRGTSDRVSVTFDAKVGVNSRGVPAYDVITDPGDYYEMAWESFRNSVYYGGQMSLGQANAYASGALISDYLRYNVYKGIDDTELIDPTTGKLNPYAYDRKWTDNWNKDVFRNGVRQEYTLTASGGSEKTQAYMSVSYLNDEGYVPASGFERISVRGKIDQTIGRRIKVGLNLAYSNTTQNLYNSSESSGSFSNLFFFGQNIAPIYPIYQYDLETGAKLYGPNGEDLYDWGENRAYGQLSNPYGQLLTSKNEQISDNISSRGYIDIQILKDLKFTANVAYDVFLDKLDYYTTPVGGDAATVNGRGQQQTNRYTALNANQLISYTPTFGDHSLSILLGHETKSDVSYALSGHMTNFVDPNNSDFANAVVYQNLTSSTSEYFLQGVFARAEYNYANKYYLSGSYRMDASSRFAPDKRWGSFWSVGASWNAKQENFLIGVGWLDALRIKASYGTQGNDNIGVTKVYEDLYTISRVDGEASIVKAFRAAPDVTWEKSDNFNAGFEARFFDRLSVNADFFIKETKDMIYYRPLAPSQGEPSTQLVNDMDMKNTGIEFEVSADIIKTPNVLWNVTINGTHYKNAITKLPSDQPQTGYNTGNYWRSLGGSLYDFYLLEWAGVDPENGRAMYNVYSQSGTGGEFEGTTYSATNATQRAVGKSAIPDLYGGISTYLSFYGFDVSASLAYQIGGWTLDSNYQGLMGSGSVGTNWHKDIFDRWTPQNTDSQIPRLDNGDLEASQTSTRFLTKASYLSLRNVTIGYTFPKRITDKIAMQNLRIYLTGDNLWYTSKRKGLDVRQTFNGSTGFTYSALRTISAGISFTF
ncbi:MAG: SusC/RagA family TonB-linked outer membrane protein [Bacteroidetes bacterium]|uniref:SusC/RagA family TonB-linked outer membrane protein n=1 Tax=Candidatus Cryptobacteroides gallistercoris TaxID=2840765 RepID=A0A940DLE0_9BACT|nr:SusC/RagA family TonB-linked outer membrane protein [Candidatus Cryptobacteroides gallistercoris]